MCYKTLFVCLCVLVVCYVSHYTLAYLGRSMQSFRQSPVVDCDTQQIRTSVIHVIFYLHFSTYCVTSVNLALCRYIVLNFNGEILGDDCMLTVT